jgi:putative flippase GtrA
MAGRFVALDARAAGLGRRLQALLWQLVRYYSISAVALGIDIGFFQGLVSTGRSATLAGAVSYALGAAFHFTANRQWNFRAFHRPARAQLVTYLIIVGTAWAVNVAVIMVCTTRLGLPPLTAKLASVVITLPLGFLGHKYFTYRYGIAGAAQQLAARWLR